MLRALQFVLCVNFRFSSPYSRAPVEGRAPHAGYDTMSSLFDILCETRLKSRVIKRATGFCESIAALSLCFQWRH